MANLNDSTVDTLPFGTIVSALDTQTSLDSSAFDAQIKGGITSGTAKNDLELRRFLVDASRHGENISLIYRETLRAMINTFSNLYYKDSQEKLIKVACIHANP